MIRIGGDLRPRREWGIWDRLSFHGHTTPPKLTSLRKHSGYLMMAPFINQTKTHLVSQEGDCPLKELAMREQGDLGM